MYNDFLFKSFVRSIEARSIVASFLSKLTGIDKEKLYNASYQGGEIPKSNENEKARACDVIVKIDNSHHIVVEMNQYDTPNLMRKNVDYVLSDIVKNTKPKHRYCTSYLINIDKFNKYNRKDPVLYFKIMNKYGDVESDVYQSIHIVVENFVNKEYNVDEEIKKFVELLGMKDLKKMKQKFQNNKEYLKAIGKVEEYMEDEEFIGAYDIAEMNEWKMNERELAGIEKGIEQEKLELAKKFKEQGVDIDLIVDATGLTKAEIEKL